LYERLPLRKEQININTMKSKVIIITGASSGIGYSTSEYLAKQGHKVYGAARRTELMEPLCNFGVTPLAIDMTDIGSIQSAVAEVISREGRIDVLVNNAGYGSYGAIEDVELSEIRHQFEVNLFGPATLTKEVIPIMRKQKSGRIINVGSLGGRVTTYLAAWYHATKYAIEAFSDSLRMELDEFGIKVSLIEPGGIKTSFGDIAAQHLTESSKGGVYEEKAAKVAEGLRRQFAGNMMSMPIVISKAISHAVNSRSPKTRYLVGSGAKPLYFLHAILPTRCFDWLIKRAV